MAYQGPQADRSQMVMAIGLGPIDCKFKSYRSDISILGYISKREREFGLNIAQLTNRALDSELKIA